MLVVVGALVSTAAMVLMFADKWRWITLGLGGASGVITLMLAGLIREATAFRVEGGRYGVSEVFGAAGIDWYFLMQSSSTSSSNLYAVCATCSLALTLNSTDTRSGVIYLVCLSVLVVASALWLFESYVIAMRRIRLAGAETGRSACQLISRLPHFDVLIDVCFPWSRLHTHRGVPRSVALGLPHESITVSILCTSTRTIETALDTQVTQEQTFSLDLVGGERCAQ